MLAIGKCLPTCAPSWRSFDRLAAQPLPTLVIRETLHGFMQQRRTSLDYSTRDTVLSGLAHHHAGQVPSMVQGNWMPATYVRDEAGFAAKHVQALATELNRYEVRSVCRTEAWSGIGQVDLRGHGYQR